ncbi:MAG: hypothetical protein WB508_01140 [Aeromicrobium sp.]|uniref:hypothetical protein n=1 Tax=Aeromicrobium sp. TaxID=1871063 RepID=UPI003C45816A
MTESPRTSSPDEGARSIDHDGLDEPFEIRRRVWLFIVVMMASWALAGAYGWLGYDREEPYLWGVAGGLFLIGLVFARMLRQVRTPLLVADLHGVRMLGPAGWVGFLWREMGDITVERRSLRHGPRVRVRGLEDRRDLTVPVGLATNVSAPRTEIELARRREAASY